MSDSEISNIFHQANKFIAHASELTKNRFISGFKSKEKADSSLVTEVDLEVEHFLRDQIMKTFPSHGIIGEELESHNPDASHVWVLDPIDGTQSFVHGIPTFGSITAILRDQEPIVGIIDHPMLNERYSAGQGMGCFCNEHRIKIQDSIGEEINKNEIITLCSKRQWDITEKGYLFNFLWDKHNYYRIYYDCYALTRAIAGQTGAALEMNVQLWDLAPCKVMIEEAGGRYVNLGKYKHKDGKVRYSALIGKPSVTKIIEKWLSEGLNYA